MYFEKYIKYKKKYLELLKNSQNNMVGGNYVLDWGVEYHYYEYGRFTFIMIFRNRNKEWYKSGPIVFIRYIDNRRLLTIEDFFNHNDYKDLNIAMVHFLKYYGVNYQQFYELFWPCFSRNLDNDCLRTESVMFFNLFDSEYTNNCRVPEPWSIIYENMLSNDWYFYDGDERFDNLDDDEGDDGTQVSCIYNDKTDSCIYFISSYRETAITNNICHLPKFIELERSGRTYPTNFSTKTEWILFCNNKFMTHNADTNLESTFAYFRGQQIPWMHYKIKDKNEFYNIFGDTAREYYEKAIKPLLFWSHSVGGVMDIYSTNTGLTPTQTYTKTPIQTPIQTSTQTPTKISTIPIEKIEKIVSYKKPININKSQQVVKPNIKNISTTGKTKMTDVFEEYDLKKKNTIIAIMETAKNLGLSVSEKNARLMFYRIENMILDRLTLNNEFKINNDLFFSELVNLTNKFFNKTDTADIYKRADMIIQKLKGLGNSKFNDNFIIEIKNKIHYGLLTPINLDVVRVVNNVPELSADEIQQIIDISKL
jgi:hypothetical protein